MPGTPRKALRLTLRQALGGWVPGPLGCSQVPVVREEDDSREAYW